MKALLIVDVQNDFVEGGALGVEGGKRVARDIGAYLTTVTYDAVFASRDAHLPDSDNGGHFSDNPDYKGTWPVHCVQGTPGFDYAIDFPEGVDVTHVIKGMGTPSYSMLEGQTLDGTPFSEIIGKYDEVDVVGIATDYCVKETAADAWEITKVNVLLNLTAGVAQETSEEAVKFLRELGVTIKDASVQCLVCDRAIPLELGTAPDEGLIFSTSGNYGSRIFDDMSGTVRLYTYICDQCVQRKIDHTHLFENGHPMTGWRYAPAGVGYITTGKES